MAGGASSAAMCEPAPIACGKVRAQVATLRVEYICVGPNATSAPFAAAHQRRPPRNSGRPRPAADRTAGPSPRRWHRHVAEPRLIGKRPLADVAALDRATPPDWAERQPRAALNASSTAWSPGCVSMARRSARGARTAACDSQVRSAGDRAGEPYGRRHPQYARMAATSGPSWGPLSSLSRRTAGARIEP